ncbi:MAG: DUF1467 family protein [Pseudomonadota bacterium]
MGIGTAIAIYFVIWWTTLFATLPFRMKSQVEVGQITEGTEPAAPVTAQMGKRMWWNTLVAAIVFGIYYVTFYVFGFSFDSIPQIAPDFRYDG